MAMALLGEHDVRWGVVSTDNSLLSTVYFETDMT